MDISKIDKNFALENISETDIEWISAHDERFTLCGVYHDGERYVRLPYEVANATNDGVANLYKHTSGGRLRFITDSPYVAVKAVIDKPDVMSNMPLTGSAGFAIYIGGVYKNTVRAVYSLCRRSEGVMNKPRGYLSSTTDDRGRKCVTDLLDGVDARVYPVGRLDLVSEGILLLTDDGELKNRLTHPSHTIGKVYRVKVAGEVSDEQMEILTSPLVIDGYKIKPVTVNVSSKDDDATVLKMTLFEGRNRQIRKMCEEAGLTVKRLSRISIGDLKLDGLPVGKWRYLEDHEVEYLYNSTKEKNQNV